VKKLKQKFEELYAENKKAPSIYERGFLKDNFKLKTGGHIDRSRSV
jgi:hypothetical protein